MVKYMDNRELFIKMGSLTLDLMLDVISNPTKPIKSIEDFYYKEYGYTFNKAFFIALISQMGIIINGDAVIDDNSYNSKLYLNKVELTKALFSSFKSTNEIIVNKKDVKLDSKNKTIDVKNSETGKVETKDLENYVDNFIEDNDLSDEWFETEVGLIEDLFDELLKEL